MKARALHYVLKTGNRREMVNFCRDLLGMKILRHEEFKEECAAQCNGPYNGKWSKTMIGYGPEDEHFVLEVVYNYSVSGYNLGNDFVGLQIESKSAYKRIKDQGTKCNFLDKDPETIVIFAPGDYLFEVCNAEHDQDLITKVSFSSSNLEKAKSYWNGLLGLEVFDETNKSCKLAYDEKECKVEFIDLGGRELKRNTASGRLAFAVEEEQLAPLQDKVLKENGTVLTKLVSLDTPGKATVQVVILADPDGLEICFVGCKGFDELSKIDPQADQLLEDAIKDDKSSEWFEKHQQEKLKE